MQSSRMMLSTVALLSLLAGAGCSGIHSIVKTDVPTMTLAELLADTAQKKEAFRLPDRGLIVRVPAGSKVPLKLSLSTPFAAIEAGDNRLRFDREVFIYVDRKRVALSPDGERWANVGDWKSMRRLFGAGRGIFSVGAGITKDEGAIVSATFGWSPGR